MQKTEYQVPNQDLKQIFKLVPDSANRLLLIEMRLILGLGLANLMTKYCIAHFSTLHRYSPVVSQAAVKSLPLQISVREQGKAICACAVRPYSAGNKDLLRNPPGQGPWHYNLIRSFEASETVHMCKSKHVLGKASLHQSPTPRRAGLHRWPWLKPKGTQAPTQATSPGSQPAWLESAVERLHTDNVRYVNSPTLPAIINVHLKLIGTELSCPNCKFLYLQR